MDHKTTCSVSVRISNHLCAPPRVEPETKELYVTFEFEYIVQDGRKSYRSQLASGRRRAEDCGRVERSGRRHIEAMENEERTGTFGTPTRPIYMNTVQTLII